MLIKLVIHTIYPWYLLLWGVVIECISMPDKTFWRDDSNSLLKVLVTSASNFIIVFEDVEAVDLFIKVVSILPWILQQPRPNTILSHIIQYFVQVSRIPVSLQYYPSLIYSPPSQSLGFLQIYYFCLLQLTRVIGMWGVCSHSSYVNIFTTIKRSCPTLTRVISPNYCFNDLTLVSIHVILSIESFFQSRW